MKGSNPRFVVTSLSKQHIDARTLYEKLYCTRGGMENRIKEQQLDLFADRTSTAPCAATSSGSAWHASSKTVQKTNVVGAWPWEVFSIFVGGAGPAPLGRAPFDSHGERGFSDE